MRQLKESSVIPAWMPESSAMDGNFMVAQGLIEQKCKPIASKPSLRSPCDWIPAWMPE